MTTESHDPPHTCFPHRLPPLRDPKVHASATRQPLTSTDNDTREVVSRDLEAQSTVSLEVTPV